MSLWEEHDLDNKIHAILKRMQYSSPDHFGQPFVSAYQIAIDIAQYHPETFQALKRPIGGRDARANSSLAQYIARELSARIKAGSIKDIEGAWLRRDYVQDILFTYESQTIAASNLDALSLFRLRET